MYNNILPAFFEIKTMMFIKRRKNLDLYQKMNILNNMKNFYLKFKKVQQIHGNVKLHQK